MQKKDIHLQLDRLAVGYKGTALIEGIEIGVVRGEILTLVGPNGAGKSTILKTITRQLAPIDGHMYLSCQGATAHGQWLRVHALQEGAHSNDPSAMQDLFQLSPPDLARQMAVVLTGRLQTELMTCRDVVAMGRYPYTGRLGILSAQDAQKVDAALAQVHAQALADRPFDAVSDGERQRILLARAICQEPDIIVLDEPTSYLDIRHKLELLSILHRMSRDQGITVVMSLHEIDLAMKISDRVLCVRGEKIFACGAPGDVLDDDAVRRLYDLDPALGRFDARTGSLELSFAGPAPAIPDAGMSPASPVPRPSLQPGPAQAPPGAATTPASPVPRPSLQPGPAQAPPGAATTPASQVSRQDTAQTGKKSPSPDAGHGRTQSEPGSGSARLPRIMIAAPGSGTGKTLLTCGLLRLLQRRGLRPAAFKCGPDYIDPMFHRQVLGIPSRNLDTFFSPADASKPKPASGSHIQDRTGAHGDFADTAMQAAPAQGNTVQAALLRAMQKHHADIAVTEGVMGYFDGTGASGTDASSFDLALQAKMPVLLVLNAKGMSRSSAALVKGMADYEKMLRPACPGQARDGICGVILNRVSAATFSMMKKWIEADTGLPVIGYLPQADTATWASRHLGLLQPAEIRDLNQQIDRIADLLEKTLDLERLLDIAREAPPLPVSLPRGGFPETSDAAPAAPSLPTDAGQSPSIGNPAPVRIAVARDEAFSFYYEDNLELLQERGAQLAFFSPIRDQDLPDADGLILGGGYPELHARALSENEKLKAKIRSLAQAGMPILAECGGFMYLQEYLEAPMDAGSAMCYPMCGILPGRCKKTGHLVRFGYIEVENRQKTAPAPAVPPRCLPHAPSKGMPASDGSGGPDEACTGQECGNCGMQGYLGAGHRIRGHEFHYYDSTDNGDACRAVKPGGKRAWDCMVVQGNIMAGFPHLYYRSDPAFVENFIDRCRSYREKSRIDKVF